MSGLLEDTLGAFSLSSLKSVQHVERTPGRAEHYLLHRMGGDTPIMIFPPDYSDLLARPVQMTPVEPGMRLVVVYPPQGEDDAFADTLPILAWALCMDGKVRPVLPSGVRRGYSPASTYDWHPDYVLLPDGSLYEYGFEAEHERYNSIDAVLAVETARAKRYALEGAERAAQKSETAS